MSLFCLCLGQEGWLTLNPGCGRALVRGRWGGGPAKSPDKSICGQDFQTDLRILLRRAIWPCPLQRSLTDYDEQHHMGIQVSLHSGQFLLFPFYKWSSWGLVSWYCLSDWFRFRAYLLTMPWAFGSQQIFLWLTSEGVVTTVQGGAVGLEAGTPERVFHLCPSQWKDPHLPYWARSCPSSMSAAQWILWRSYWTSEQDLEVVLKYN